MSHSLRSVLIAGAVLTSITVAQFDPQLTGTWSTKSNTVFTGPVRIRCLLMPGFPCARREEAIVDGSLSRVDFNALLSLLLSYLCHPLAWPFISSRFVSFISKLHICAAWKRRLIEILQGFYDPVNEKMIEPAHTGISYSFTDDGHYEEAYYRAISNRMLYSPGTLCA